MSAAAPLPPLQPRSRSWHWPLALSLTVAGVLAFYLRQVEEQVLEDASIVADGAARPVQVAEVDRALEAMSLVTVILETKVTASAGDESWRGDVHASVTVPVRLLFGTDLSRAHVDVQNLSPITRTYRVTCPTPERLATELFTGREAAEVQLGWLRFRTRAGEYYLGQARTRLTEAASSMRLNDDDARRVREQTRERVLALVRLVLGDDEARRASVEVVFSDDDPGDGPRAASAGEPGAGAGAQP